MILSNAQPSIKPGQFAYRSGYIFKCLEVTEVVRTACGVTTKYRAIHADTPRNRSLLKTHYGQEITLSHHEGDRVYDTCPE